MHTARQSERSYSDALHVQIELVGQVSKGQGSAGSERGDVHVGNEIIVLWYHLQGEMCSETIAAQAPPQTIHHSCADRQLVIACALACRHVHNRVQVL